MKKKLIPFFTAITIIVVSCQHEVPDAVKKTSTFKTINDFHEMARKEQQSFTINNTSGDVITTSRQTKLYLPANGFITEDGRRVTGNINVSVKEIYTPVEMIFNDMPTTSGNLLLESGGEFRVKASQNNESLKLAPGSYIRIGIPDIGRNMQGMQVFNGTLNAAGSVNWAVNANPGNFVVGDSTLFSKSNLFCDSINWINCDRFINEPTVEFSVYPGNAPSGDSTNVLIHLTGRNTVVKMSWTQGLNYFKSTSLLAVPSTIVGISVRHGQLYASVISVNVQNGQSVTLNFLPYTEQQLKERLSQLR
jgi:hypothetical protein